MPIECRLPNLSFETSLSSEITILTTLFRKTKILVYRFYRLTNFWMLWYLDQISKQCNTFFRWGTYVCIIKPLKLKIFVGVYFILSFWNPLYQLQYLTMVAPSPASKANSMKPWLRNTATKSPLGLFWSPLYRMRPFEEVGRITNSKSFHSGDFFPSPENIKWEDLPLNEGI